MVPRLVLAVGTSRWRVWGVTSSSEGPTTRSRRRAEPRRRERERHGYADGRHGDREPAFAGMWPQYTPIYPAGMGAVQSRYDWSVCGKQGGPVEVVRRVHDNGANDQFQHMTYFNGSWMQGSAIPPDAGLVNAGIVLLRGNSTLGLFAISGDVTSAIHYTLSNGSAWGPWQKLVSSIGMRNHLAGSGWVDTAHPTLIWTQSTSSANDVFGVPLGSLLP